MSVAYRAVGWNRQKRLYDLAVAGVAALAALGFATLSLALNSPITFETLLLRGSALASFVLLHALLCIGPLARLDRRFLPLLYNRRHLGVAIFALGLVHGTVAVVQFHALGNANPLVSIWTAYGRDFAAPLRGVAGIVHLPFEPFGILALAILFLMAATSHDFWLRNLGPSFWKALHLGIFAAYGMLVTHVAYGLLQSERHPAWPALLGIGVAGVLGLHLAAAAREARVDRPSPVPGATGMVPVCRADHVPEGGGRVVGVGGRRRVAIFRHQGKLHALSNVCRHQGGPIGEGRIVDGCVTCPWHGWQYRPEDGMSPPPFREVLETYRVREKGGLVWVDPTPVGTPTSPARLGGAE